MSLHFGAHSKYICGNTFPFSEDENGQKFLEFKDSIRWKNGYRAWAVVFYFLKQNNDSLIYSCYIIKLYSLNLIITNVLFKFQSIYLFLCYKEFTFSTGKHFISLI